jgi:hypothetical protein
MNVFEWPLSNSQIKELFNADLVSFDLFDTLVCRPKQKDYQFHIYGHLGKVLRTLLEFFWRFLQKLGFAKEFKLEFLRIFFGKSIQKEFDFDLENLVLREVVARLMIELHQSGSKVVIVSNTYYSSYQIRQICQKFKFPEDIQLILSSDHGLTKSQGLFSVSNNLTIKSHWHFGDDKKEDSCVSEDVFVFIGKIYEINPFFNGSLYVSPKNSLINFNTARTFLKVMVSHESEKDPWFWFGVFYSAPFAISISEALVRVAESESAPVIYFLARDGYLPNRYLEMSGKYVSFYLPFSRMISKSDQNLKTLKAFMETESGKGAKIVFDLGWRGISSSKLRMILGQGAVLVLLGRWPWHRKTEDLHLLTGSWRTLYWALRLRRCPELIELALTAPHETLVNLPHTFKGWSNSIRFPTDHVNSQIAFGAEAFFTKYLEGKPQNFGVKPSIVPLLNLIKRPTQGFLSIASQIFHEYEGMNIPLVSTGRTPVVYWLKGSLKQQKKEGIPLRTRFFATTIELLRRLGYKYIFPTNRGSSDRSE